MHIQCIMLSCPSFQFGISELNVTLSINNGVEQSILLLQWQAVIVYISRLVVTIELIMLLCIGMRGACTDSTIILLYTVC